MALRKARESLGLRQGELAKMINKNQSEVGRWEKTTAEPLDFNKEVISQVLKKRGVSITPCKGGWEVRFHDFAQEGFGALSHVKDKIAEYRAKERTLDDLPEIVELKHELEGWIDELVRNRKKNG